MFAPRPATGLTWQQTVITSPVLNNTKGASQVECISTNWVSVGLHGSFTLMHAPTDLASGTVQIFELVLAAAEGASQTTR
jgi:hypothetical protein